MSDAIKNPIEGGQDMIPVDQNMFKEVQNTALEGVQNDFTPPSIREYFYLNARRAEFYIPIVEANIVTNGCLQPSVIQHNGHIDLPDGSSGYVVGAHFYSQDAFDKIYRSLDPAHSEEFSYAQDLPEGYEINQINEGDIIIGVNGSFSYDAKKNDEATPMQAPQDGFTLKRPGDNKLVYYFYHDFLARYHYDDAKPRQDGMVVATNVMPDDKEYLHKGVRVEEGTLLEIEGTSHETKAGSLIVLGPQGNYDIRSLAMAPHHYLRLNIPIINPACSLSRVWSGKNLEL